jgi:ferric-dicitrate binding protein FerR (iron transport regulator)
MTDKQQLPETLMAYLDGELTVEEARAFEALLEEHPEWRSEVAQMRAVVGASAGLRFRSAPEGTWDNYWEEIDSRIAKPIGWILAGIGGFGLAVAGAVKVFLLAENLWVRVGLGAVVAGLLLLFLSVLRGHLLERPRDRYRRIRR